MRTHRRIVGIGLVMLALSIAHPAHAQKGATPPGGGTDVLLEYPTMDDAAPTLTDLAPTLGAQSESTGEGGYTPSGTGGTEVPPTDDVPVSQAPNGPSCVIDITANLPAEGEGTSVSTPSAAETAEPGQGDQTASGGIGDAEPECVSMVDARVTSVNGAVTPATGGSSATEALILTRLQERRMELETQQSTLKLQEDLLRAAELRLGEQAAMLEASKNELYAAADAETARKAEELVGLARLFETMKPKDAAAIMAGLPDETRVPLAKLVSTRKLAPIMAELSPERAGALTVLLAQAK